MIYTLTAPVLETHDGIVVVRDDLMPGGTKRRGLEGLRDACLDDDELVYASPVFGAAQIALAYAARDWGKRASVFCAKRNELHPLTAEAQRLGATIHQVPDGMLSVVTARARAYAVSTDGARLLPFGLDHPDVINAIAHAARFIDYKPREVWSIASSGVLTRSLQLAWPLATFYGVQVGAEPDAGRATIYKAPERFEQNAKQPPPFPCSPTYDAKAWQFIRAHAAPGALFWSVA